MPKNQLSGIVVSAKMAKTVVVRVERWKEHPRYRRRIKLHSRYKADTALNQYELGDKVIIEEMRPLSKDKRWRVIKKI